MTRWRGSGPGIIVAAAFIGPGTVTTATVAGAQFGTSLLWALLFATVATMILQEMSARLGLITRAGLGQALRTVPGPSWLGPTLAWLGTAAVVAGAAAFEAGNLTGAGLGLEAVLGLPIRFWAGLTATAAGILLWTGRYRILERALSVCVAVMGLVFLLTAAVAAPALGEIIRGSLLPSFEDVPNLRITAIGLIGTTIVPYNLFLHASATRERWKEESDLSAVRWDLVIAIGLGGIVSGAVVVTASAALGGVEVTSASDMAAQLRPLLGDWASVAFATGLAAAGISSSITAPLAAAYATLDVMGRSQIKSRTSRTVWGGTILIGLVVTLSGFRPVPLILFAQVLNGLILPIVAVVLLIAMNDRSRLGNHVNRWYGNVAGVLVVLLCAGLGLRTIFRVF